jgi:hypothetical protein
MKAMSKGVHRVFVILSKTKDNNENPIFCPEKINALKSMIDILQKRIGTHVDVVLICVPDEKGATPFTSIINIVSSHEFASLPDVNLILVIGDDRAGMGTSIRKMFIGKSNVRSVESEILTRSDMSEYKRIRGRELCETSMSTVPPSALSASFVRNVVRDCPPDKFMELYGPYLEPEQIDILYSTVRNGLEIRGGKRINKKSKSNKKRKTIRKQRKTIRKRR